MKTLLYILLGLGATLGTVALYADEQSTGEIARSGETTQGEIQEDSKKLVAEIDATIDEYERNGLKGEELDNLKKLRKVLANMSDTEMAKILDLLQQAGAKADPKTKLKALVDAYSAQKGVLSQLQQILNDYATEQDAANLAKQVSDLADRQATNLQTGIETAQWALRGGTRDDTSAAAAADFSMQAQASEQKAIADALKQLQAKIAEMAANPNDPELAARFKKGLEEIGVLNPILDNASGLLDQKRLFDAVTNEKTARDGLRQLARTISPPRDEGDALLAASAELDKIIALQKEIMPPTDSGKLLPIEQWLAAMLQDKSSNIFLTANRLHQLNLTPAQLAQLNEYKDRYREQLRITKERLSGLEDQEGDVANQTDSLSQDIASVAKPASDFLWSAMPPMQTARGNLVDGDGINALVSEGEALAWLEKAKASLDGQLSALAKEEKTSDTTTDPAEMQKQAQELLAQQAQIAKETAQPNTPDQAAALAKEQAALEQKTQDLQQAATGTPAAQPLSAAAQNMQQAATAMSTPSQNAQAQAQQQQAMQNLAAAGQQLAQQAAQADQAAQQAAADQKELEALAKIIEDEQKLQVDTLQAAPKQAKQPALVSALAPRQQSIKQDTDDFQKTLTPGAGGADPQLIASASNHMGDAFGHLGKADGTNAAPDEKKALDDLYAAQAALQAAMNAAQQQAGQAQTPQQQAQADAQAAQAAAAIAQAQQQVNQAMSAMSQQSDAGQQSAANDLGQAAQTTGSAAAQDSALPGDAQQAMQAADQALAQASGQAAAGQTGQAQASAQQAQAALGQAQAAMAQAQAGLAASGQGQGMGQGQGQGQGTGQSTGQGGQGQGQGAGSGSGSGSGAGNTGITGPQTQGNGQRTASKAQFMDLPPRDRAAIQESQGEKYPQQYATKVEQYLQNLADGGDKQ